MNIQLTNQNRYAFVALVALAGTAHLSWEFFHGGVISHHFLARADMPSISNWWGLLWLPVLAWFATGRARRRLATASGGNAAATNIPAGVAIGFFGALLFAGALAFAFANGYPNAAEYLFQAILLLAILLPVYRAECVLGFVLGMTVVVGAVLPTIIGTVIAALSAIVHPLIRPFLVRLWRRFK